MIHKETRRTQQPARLSLDLPDNTTELPVVSISATCGSKLERWAHLSPATVRAVASEDLQQNPRYFRRRTGPPRRGAVYRPSQDVPERYRNGCCHLTPVTRNKVSAVAKKIKHADRNVLREDEMDIPIHTVTISRDFVNLGD